MRDGVNRRHVIGGLALVSALGLGGCVTDGLTGSVNSTVNDGPDGDGRQDGASYVQSHIDSAREGGVMIVLSREADAPQPPMSFGLIPVTISDGKPVPSGDDSVVEELVSPAASPDGRHVRTFDVPPGTYVLARIDAGSKPFKAGGFKSNSGTFINPGMSPLAFGAAVLIGTAIATIAANPTGSRPYPPAASSPPVETSGMFRTYFAKDGTIFSQDAVIFTVQPGKVTYIGDFRMVKPYTGGPRILDYSFDPEMTTLAEPPTLPISLDTLQRPTKETVRFYLG